MAAVLFPYRPLAPLLERWQWRTDIAQTQDGKETRRAVRDVPRQTWEWELVLSNRAYNSLTRGQHTLTFLVPSWQEAELTTAPIDNGATEVSVDTTVSDWRGSILLWKTETYCESIVISSVDSGVIYLDSEVVGDYPTGSTVAPVRIARLANPVDLRVDRLLTLLSLNWLILDPTALDDYDWTIQFGGLDLITDLYLLEGEFVARTLEADVEAFDYETGEVGYEVQYDPDLWNMPTMFHQLFSAAEMWKWKKWFHKMQGRKGEFWLPTWKSDLILASSFTADDVWLIIQNIGYVTYLDALSGNKALYFQRPGSLDPLPRSIIDSEAIDADTEKIKINTNLGFAGSQQSFERISWLHPCRLNSDQIELEYNPGHQTTISVPIRERIL